jgi:endonuclease/exonuclease/phosphatase family metal-dependent hydrolase
LEKNISKREESAKQVVSHIRETEPLLRKEGWENILLVVAGDMNTDPADTDRFGKEQTFALFKELGLKSDLEDVPLTKRVTLPAEGRYPDAGFDWILVRPVEGVKWRSKVAMPGDEISDHRPVVLEVWRKDTS